MLLIARNITRSARPALEALQESGIDLLERSVMNKVAFTIMERGTMRRGFAAGSAAILQGSWTDRMSIFMSATIRSGKATQLATRE
jgi:hypothetical protein